jgi:hypothetical protein
VTAAPTTWRYGRRVDESADLELPAELEAGVYGDRLDAWFTRHQLILDFGSSASEDTVIATARVRVPATAAFDVLLSLQECVRNYELQYGEIHRPRKWDEE